MNEVVLCNPECVYLVHINKIIIKPRCSEFFEELYWLYDNNWKTTHFSFKFATSTYKEPTNRKNWLSYLTKKQQNLYILLSRHSEKPISFLIKKKPPNNQSVVRNIFISSSERDVYSNWSISVFAFNFVSKYSCILLYLLN